MNERPSLTAAEERLTLGVEGMTCGGCAATVQRGLAAVDGVLQAEVDLAGKRAEIRYDPSKTGRQALENAVRQAGYRVGSNGASRGGLVALAPAPAPPAARVEPERAAADFEIRGMTCAGCVRTIERRLLATPGVFAAEVNLAAGSARVTFDPAQVDAPRVAAAVASAGYEARPRRKKAAIDASAREEERGWRRRFWVALVFTIPLLALAMSHGVLHIPYEPFVQLALALPVVIYGGGPIYRRAALGLRHNVWDMNTLIALGTGAAFVYSLVATFAPGAVAGAGAAYAPVYYETAAAILMFILLGRSLEARARGRTSAAIEELAALSPKRARVVRDGVEREIAAEEVLPGDLVLLRPGERIAADGVVVEGRSAVDEATLTGESVPVEKQPGDRVLGGTINASGSLRFRAEKVGAETALAQVIELVQQAQATKAPIARLADRVAAYFTPAVLAVAAATFAAWFLLGPPDERLRLALVNAVAVLIIACPCALGLATPTALITAIGRGAGFGALIRNGAALEQAGRIDTVAFDKTGTLTRGRPEVTDVVPVNAWGRRRPAGRRSGGREAVGAPLGASRRASRRGAFHA